MGIIATEDYACLVSLDVPIATVDESVAILRHSKRIAVLGAKPASRLEEAAYWVPLMLQRVGYDVIPVPVRYPETTMMLGRPVFRRVQDVPAPIDILSVFRKPADMSPHLPDILAACPKVVWFQSGLLEETTAHALWTSGITIVHDCIACRRATIAPSTAPLEGQL